MSDAREIPLILGGHSFFSGLGNDPVPDEAAQREIVRACLDSGITWFDTTHQPERLALGKALHSLGRRNEASIFAWNFMQVLEPGEKLDRPVEYKLWHLDQLLGELRTGHIDCLVVHDLDGGTPEQHERQEALAQEWLRNGYVKALGVWAPGDNVRARYGGNSAFSFMVRPFNITTESAGPVFEACKGIGWRNYACSPFVRGWELEKMAAKALAQEGGDEAGMRIRLADLMLRYSLFQPHVDKLITAIRRVEWIRPNIESVRRGPLSLEERAWLTALRQGS